MLTVKDIVENSIAEALETRDDLFVVDLNISSSLDINITIDGDQLVKVTDCIELSRKIEQNLDRDEHDFSIKIQSPGADAPLIKARQYQKHVGRVLKIKTKTGKEEGQLVHVDDEAIKLAWKSREKKPVGKGKVTVLHEKKISFTEIENAKIKLTFNTK